MSFFLSLVSSSPPTYLCRPGLDACFQVPQRRHHLVEAGLGLGRYAFAPCHSSCLDACVGYEVVWGEDGRGEWTMPGAGWDGEGKQERGEEVLGEMMPLRDLAVPSQPLYDPRLQPTTTVDSRGKASPRIHLRFLPCFLRRSAAAGVSPASPRPMMFECRESMRTPLSLPRCDFTHT